MHDIKPLSQEHSCLRNCERTKCTTNNSSRRMYNLKQDGDPELDGHAEIWAALQNSSQAPVKRLQKTSS